MKRAEGYWKFFAWTREKGSRERFMERSFEENWFHLAVRRLSRKDTGLMKKDALAVRDAGVFVQFPVSAIRFPDSLMNNGVSAAETVFRFVFAGP